MKGGGRAKKRITHPIPSHLQVISLIDTLFLRQDLLNHFYAYVPPTDPSWPRRVKYWWKRIRAAAKQSRMGRHLPDTYVEMRTK